MTVFSCKKAPFALFLHEYPETLNDVIKGKHGMTRALSLNIDKALGLEEGTMLALQAYYEIKKKKQKEESKHHPDLSIIRKILFWDVYFSKSIHPVSFQTVQPDEGFFFLGPFQRKENLAA